MFNRHHLSILVTTVRSPAMSLSGTLSSVETGAILPLPTISQRLVQPTNVFLVGWLCQRNRRSGSSLA